MSAWNAGAMSERWVRVGRGLAAAAVAVFVAAFSHAAAGGGAPGVVGLVISLAFAAMICVALTRRRPSVPLLALSVLISQFVFHLLFGVGDRGASGLSVATVQHGSHSMTALIPATGGQLVAGQTAHAHATGWMWVAHAVAGVVTIVALRHGESALRRLVALGRAKLWLPAGTGVRRAALAVLACAGTVAGVARSGGLVTARRQWVRSRALPVPSPLRDLGPVFDRLRHRGPPARFTAHVSA